MQEERKFRTPRRQFTTIEGADIVDVVVVNIVVENVDVVVVYVVVDFVVYIVVHVDVVVVNVGNSCRR